MENNSKNSFESCSAICIKAVLCSPQQSSCFSFLGVHCGDWVAWHVAQLVVAFNSGIKLLPSFHVFTPSFEQWKHATVER